VEGFYHQLPDGSEKPDLVFCPNAGKKLLHLPSAFQIAQEGWGYPEEVSGAANLLRSILFPEYYR